jgi:spore coat protein YsxE
MKLVEERLSRQEKEELIYKEYDFYPQSIENFGSVSKITCDRGIFALKKTSVGQGQLLFLEKTFHYLERNRFNHYVPFYPNKFWDSYLAFQNECYYVTPWIEDIMEEKYCDNWELKMMQCIGRLHRATSNFEESNAKQPSLSSRTLLQRWHKRLVHMIEYKKFAQDREMMSPIEVAFVSHFEYLHELGLRAIRYLREWIERAAHQEEMRTVLCHGHVHRKNVLQNKDEIYLIDFDQAVMGSPARDLALFYRRHIEKAMDWEDETALEWLKVYEEEFPLEREDKILLAIYLLFPEKAFKEIELYYQGARDWNALKQVRYFERQMKATYLIRKFVKEMLG